MKKYRIIWVIDSLKPGGAEQLMPTLLGNFDKDQFDMRVCVLQVKRGNPIFNDLISQGIITDLVQIYSLKNPFNVLRVLNYFRQHSPDLIHTQLGFADILGNVAAKIMGRPSVSTLHTLDILKTEKKNFSVQRQKLKWFVLNNFCDQIIAVSQKTLEHHVQVGKIKREKIITIYNGIQLSRFRNRDVDTLKSIKNDFNIDPKHKVITTVAVLRKPKGIQYMIEAMSDILKAEPNITYLVVGNGVYEDDLRYLVTEKKLQKHVIFTGRRTDIPDILGLSDLFVLPSLGDALPTVLIEALASETPVIATHIGGIPEIIENNSNGLLVPPSDPQSLTNACLKILRNPEFAKTLTKNGSKRVETFFDVKVQVEHLENLYKDLISKYEPQDS